ncbi:MAG: bacillithiol biosynthesis BshC, partial [Bacteroidota bacterium]
MELKKVDFKDTRQFSNLFLDYINGSDQLNEFYGNSPTVEGFAQQIKNKNLS